jgi:hypothetical protein
MNIIKKTAAILPGIIAVLCLAPQAFAAAPDGLGPWADTVVSTNQGLMKNGLPVPAIRSDPTSALGVAEGTTIDGNFFSLGFGGNIVLGFDNGISSGVFVFEETNATPDYPVEKAKVEISENGTTWVNAGTVSQDGEVKVPDAVNCAKYVRLTDTSDASIMPDAIADGYDVDGVEALGESCTPPPVFPSCTTKSGTPGDKAHYLTGMHQIVGGSVLSGSDDVYSLENNNYLQCFCPTVGIQGIQTNWFRTDSAIAGWFFLNGSQWNLGNVNYAAKNVNFTCPAPTPTSAPLTLAKNLFTPKPTVTPTPVSHRLGGLNLDGYCRSLHQEGGSLISQNNWVCRANKTVINLTQACQWQYNATAIAKQDRKGNPYSWSCY